MTAYQRAGDLAAKREDWGIAAQHYEQAVNVLDRHENTVRFLWAMNKVVNARSAQGEGEAAMRWCDRALATIAEQSFPNEEKARAHFRIRLADVSDVDGGTPRTYDRALRSVIEADEATAHYLLRHVWRRYDAVDESSPLHRVILAADVCYVAHGRVIDDEARDCEAILDTIEPEKERLTDAATALFEQLTDEETDIETDELTTDVDTTERKTSLGTLEEAASAQLFDSLVEN
ncbi:hypothetical protein [Haladaptatus sp. DFWS20]|uniref:hypothetical protein n=1 Tax=Haladaptatus sp. DFWS20 TaxID=3403467 RepID=UPI003EB95A65